MNGSDEDKSIFSDIKNANIEKDLEVRKFTTIKKKEGLSASKKSMS